jgi:hypothetical protein
MHQAGEMAFPSRMVARPIRWRWVVVGGVLSALFTLLAGLASAPSRSAIVVAVLNAAAFLLAGGLTLWISWRMRGPAAAPRDPAIGAGLMAAIVGGVQAMSLRGRVEGLTPARLFVSWLVLVLLAYLLTWIGGRIVQLIPRRRTV